jgi:hypothetical protein
MANEHRVPNAAAATVENEWDAAEESLLNPHQAAIDEGYEEGRAAGLQSGLEEGKHIGQTNAKEIGVQLGFILGCCEVVKAQILRDAETKNVGDDKTNNDAKEGSEIGPSKDKPRQVRILQTVDVLTNLIEDFPGPDQLFANNQKVSAGQDDDVREGVKNIDVNVELQEIKAKVSLIRITLHDATVPTQPISIPLRAIE